MSPCMHKHSARAKDLGVMSAVGGAGYASRLRPATIDNLVKPLQPIQELCSPKACVDVQHISTKPLGNLA
jgi:hypothetical protein